MNNNNDMLNRYSCDMYTKTQNRVHENIDMYTKTQNRVHIVGNMYTKYRNHRYNFL